MSKCKALLVIVAILSIMSSGVAIAGDPKDAGDVVARDLNFVGLGWLGHVGIWTGDKVLEVLDKTPVIQKNTLSSFKSASKYWGAKYGKAGTNGYKIVNAGWNQSNYSPSYTKTTTWREGKYISQSVWDSKLKKYVTKQVMQTAQFRCDTFVDYSYWKGTGSFLANVAITPSIIYNALPKTR